MESNDRAGVALAQPKDKAGRVEAAAQCCAHLEMNMPVLVDESLDGAADLYFEGGDHRTLVHVGGDAFRALTKDAPRARFSHPAG